MAKHESAGSSPHTRGAPSRLSGRSGRVGDHPRIRGEHVRASLMPPCQRGSSPHTRGAHPIFDETYRKGRIIPAYAGSTFSPICTREKSRDHPRIRGEHMCPASLPRGLTGSSPHTRGALVWFLADEDAVGIIPAYAGSTLPHEIVQEVREDHPRIRGEHAGLNINPRSDGGSSPHTRGAPACFPADFVELRIIPAYAGSTRSALGACRKPSDHPRIRGEHQLSRLQYLFHQGSSPHTRGALHD